MLLRAVPRRVYAVIRKRYRRETRTRAQPYRAAADFRHSAGARCGLLRRRRGGRRETSAAHGSDACLITLRATAPTCAVVHTDASPLAHCPVMISIFSRHLCTSMSREEQREHGLR